MASVDEDAAGGGDVEVVAADGDSDVAFIGDGCVSGVESEPSEVRQQALYPCVSGRFGRLFAVKAGNTCMYPETYRVGMPHCRAMATMTWV